MDERRVVSGEGERGGDGGVWRVEKVEGAARGVRITGRGGDVERMVDSWEGVC
jgi:hypothetical protein